MKTLGSLLLTSALALALIGAAVFAYGDRTVLVSPPEAVVEGFVRQLAARRYDRALPYLSEHLRRQTTAETLRVRAWDLERRAGRIEDARGAPGWIVGDRAYASAEVKIGRKGAVRMGFGLHRERGLWRIDELYDLGWTPQNRF